MPNDFVIKLNFRYGTMFWMGRPDWSGCHFTYDIGKARRYRLKHKPEQVISTFSWQKDGLSPQAIAANEWFI